MTLIAMVNMTLTDDVQSVNYFFEEIKDDLSCK